MQAHLSKEIITRINDIEIEGVGAVSQNASERVGSTVLSFCSKGTELKSTHYVASTSLGISSVNTTVIVNFLREFDIEPADRRRISEWGVWQSRLYDLIGMSYSEEQEQQWFDEALRRSQQSRKRKTVEYKQQRKLQRKRLTERRGAQSGNGHAYKRGAGTGNGEVGECHCTGACIRRCPCKQAGDQCDVSCHPRNSKCVNCPAGVVRAAAAAASNAASRGQASSSAADNGADDFADAVPLADVPDFDYASLCDASVRYNWDGIGWLTGVITEIYEGDQRPPPVSRRGERPNAFIWFDVDEDDGAQVYLARETYSTRRDAPPGSWHILEE